MPNLISRNNNLTETITLPLSFVDSGMRIAFAKASRPVNAELSSAQRQILSKKTLIQAIYIFDNFQHRGFLWLSLKLTQSQAI